MYFSHLMLCDRREGLSSQERYEQALRVVTQALDQGDDLTYAMPLFKGEHVTIWPRPVQHPIPYWGAAISAASFTRYGQ